MAFKAAVYDAPAAGLPKIAVFFTDEYQVLDAIAVRSTEEGEQLIAEILNKMAMQDS